MTSGSGRRPGDGGATGATPIEEDPAAARVPLARHAQTGVDLALRLGKLGAALAKRMPGVLDATIALLESVSPVVVLETTRPDRYEIKHLIGAGGHAEVFLGFVRGAYGFVRPVAIRRVRSDLARTGQPVATLLEEALHACRLSHPNVVAVLDFDRDIEGRPYLVMEHVDGVNLAKLIEAGPVPHPVAIFIVRELLAGLGYIHEPRDEGPHGEPGLVQRDVTPRNVLLSWTGEVKLADFGLAQMLQRTMGLRSLEGTPGYMSPEQARREDVDGRSDLYATGIVLWELLASQRLRPGLPGDLFAPLSFRDIPRPSEHREVSADLEAIALRLLAHDRDERYPTAELAARDLVRCRDFPRDGRGALVRLLDERFPRARRRGPFSPPSGPGSPSSASRTSTAPSALAPTGAPAAPGPEEPEPGPLRTGTPGRARRRGQGRGRGLAYVVLARGLAYVALVLATLLVLLALLMLR